MNQKFYIADWHYGHANCIHFDARPFKDVDEMNEQLIKRWNEKVDNGDMVYVLGDMFWCNSSTAVEVLKQLNGQKYLIKGNHDCVSDSNFKKSFVNISPREIVKDGDDHIVLDHFPCPYFQNHFYGYLHFYGHVHTSFEHNMALKDRHLIEALYDKPCKMYNVGAMMPYINYTPRTKEEILVGGEEYYKRHFQGEVEKNLQK